VADLSHCPQCGTVSRGAGLRGLCPTCLLGLALDADGDGEPGDDPSFPLATYRVLTVLSSEPGRSAYLAEHGQTRQLVTLDVVRIQGAGSDDGLAECSERLRALKLWVHPGVPRVIDGRRTPSGDFCVVAHYVNGPRLDQFCETSGLDTKTRVGLFARVCDIVMDGHRRDICHGRLRPDLIIVSGSRGDVVPVILGYSVIPDRAPTAADDLSGLETLASAMGWRGPDGRAWPSVDALRDAAAHDWRRLTTQNR
jgi:hypothetical protein